MNTKATVPATRSVRKTLQIAVVGLAVAGVLSACSNAAVETTPQASSSADSTAELKPFVWDQDGGKVPDLPSRIAFANTSNAEFFLSFSDGIQAAAKDRNVDYVTAIADDNPEKNVQQIQSFLSRGVGVLMYQPLDMASQKPILDGAIADGLFVPGLISSPSTLQIAASQYNIGFTQGKAAADWAVKNLGGKAQVLYFNLDTVGPQLVLRHNGVLAGLATGGKDITVVSDIGSGISTEDGFTITSTALQAHPEINMVLGGDTLVVGALQAIQQAGLPTDKMYLSGVDGDKQALAAIKEGGAYKASIAFPWALMGYGIGQFGADWLAGKEVPRVIVAAPTIVDSPAKVDEFLAANADPGKVFKDRALYEKYLPLLGQISYATHENAWSTEYVPK